MEEPIVPDDSNSLFKKVDGESVLYANIVESADYYLSLETIDNYTYPVDGWEKNLVVT